MKKNIIIGVCGGIAIYKVCILVRMLIRDGFSVKVIMTDAATKFISPLVFKTLSNNYVYTDTFVYQEHDIQHISLSQWADLFVIAPLTANTLSKISLGICDNLLTTVVVSFPPEKRIVLVPAMDSNMWCNHFIQDNLERLEKISQFIVIPPEEGVLASGLKGKGRMAEVETIYQKIKDIST